MKSRNPKNLIPIDSEHIKIAIAGVGQMGKFHLESLKQLAAGASEDYYKGSLRNKLTQIKICGLCENKLEKLDEFKNEFNLYCDFEKMLAETKPHIVIIAVPTVAHFEFAKKALASGVHTFVEKPLVTSKKQMDLLVKIAADRGCGLMSGHLERYNPVAVKIVSFLEQNKNTQKIKDYSFIRTQKHDERIPDDIITDKVVHDLDLSLYFFGPIKKVQLKDVVKKNELVYQASLNVVHENGIKGKIFVSWLVKDDEKVRTIEINCQKDQLKGDFVDKKFTVNGKDVQCQVPGMINPVNNQIKDELVDFIIFCCEKVKGEPEIPPLLGIEEITETVGFIDQLIRETKM